MRDDHENLQDLFHPAAFEIADGDGSDGTVRLVVSGELDLASSPQLAARLDEFEARGAPVYLDISGLTFIDSSGLAVLIRHAQDAGRDGRLEIGRDGLHRHVQRVIELLGAEQALWPSQASGSNGGAST